MTVPKKGQDARSHMLQVNARQKAFYESRFDAFQAGTPHHERAANVSTNLWSRMRRRLIGMRQASSVDSYLLALHQEWLAAVLPGARVLDLGCFSGNPLSFWIAERCADYTGIDLSEQAIAQLNAQLVAKGLSGHARARAQDFLANDYSDQYFDVIYARSVLHHFQDVSIVLREMQRVLRPGGLMITLDPLATEPLNRIMRALYRPMQSDRAWEWPFTRRTLRAIDNTFTITGACGYGGMEKLAYPFYLFPGTQRLGHRVGRWATAYDIRHTNHLGLPLYLCWGVTLRLSNQK